VPRRQVTVDVPGLVRIITRELPFMRIALVCYTLALLLPVSMAAQGADSASALVGLHGVIVVPRGAPPVDTSEIRTLAELTLRTAGITVVTDMSERTDRDAIGILVVGLDCLPVQEPSYAYMMDARLYQLARLVRPSKMAPSTFGTWEAGGSFGVVGSAGKLREVARDEVRAMVEKFANAYLASNPKK